jgi:Trk K+ transport system NAD-binding subunit
MSARDTQAQLDRFLVCGLGSLGQHCVAALKEFGVSVIAIDQIQPQSWEISNLPNLLEDLVLGDCRQNNILEQAKIQRCRAALIVTSNEQVNAETALAIRQLNRYTRLVVRSAQENLNQLLSERLGNFIAFDPIQLPASAFAFAALGSDTLGFFKLDGQWLQVFKRQIEQSDRWCNSRLLHELNSRQRRLLSHTHYPIPLPQTFHDWEPDVLLQPKDTLVYLETAEQLVFYGAPTQQQPKRRGWKAKLLPLPKQLRRQLAQFWQLSFQQQVRRVAIVCGVIVLILLVIGTFLFRWHYRGINFLEAFYTTVILLLGGYGDLFGGFETGDSIPWWLQLFSLGLSLAGTAFVGVLYALLTEALLSSKFQFVQRRPPIPQQNHVAIIGLGRVGQRVATLLREFKQSLVGITFNVDFEEKNLPEVPLIFGNLKNSLSKANLGGAKSVIVVTDDEILNLEVALMARKINPKSHLVIRTSSRHLSEHLSQLLPDAQVLGTATVVAEAFAAAAFGENIIALFRFDDRTILVTEYQIEVQDTLNGLLLSEVAYGFGVVPILYQKPPNASNLMPLEDIQLAVGDRLVILATIDGLQRIECGKLDIAGKRWQVSVKKALSADASFEGANAIARISGCSLGTAREFMNHLPGTLSVALYKHQAQRLVRELNKLLVKAELIPLGDRINNWSLD